MWCHLHLVDQHRKLYGLERCVLDGRKYLMPIETSINAASRLGTADAYPKTLTNVRQGNLEAANGESDGEEASKTWQ
jgi:hypothetical protein